jgi:hypothetical protein
MTGRLRSRSKTDRFDRPLARFAPTSFDYAGEVLISGVAEPTKVLPKPNQNRMVNGLLAPLVTPAPALSATRFYRAFVR